MSAAVSLPDEPTEVLELRAVFDVAHREVRRCMATMVVLQAEADSVLGRFAPAHAELEMWTGLAEQAARAIAQRTE